MEAKPCSSHPDAAAYEYAIYGVLSALFVASEAIGLWKGTQHNALLGVLHHALSSVFGGAKAQDPPPAAPAPAAGNVQV